MTKGKRTIQDLSEKEKEELLWCIMQNCLDYAEDSYSLFGREALRNLVMFKLVEYGGRADE